MNTIVINGSGSIWLQQGDRLAMNDYGNHNVQYRVEDSVLYLEGVGSRLVTFQELSYLKISGTAGVRSKGVLRGENLSVVRRGVGEVSLELGYDNVYVRSSGVGDVVLLGDCNVFCSEEKSVGKVNAKQLNYKVLVQKSGDQWNMALNLNDAIDMEWARNAVREAQPFFEAESNRLWDSGNDRTQGTTYTPDMSELPELMRELGEHLQTLSDSVDWKSLEQDMEQWGREMEEWGRKMEKWGEGVGKKHDKSYENHDERSNNTAPDNEEPKKKSHVLNPHWAGFDAGLNMLIDPSVMNVYTGSQETMAIRPLRSWYFGFNIVDVGVAFDSNRRVGVFTGIGVGWNNYSWKNYVRMTVDDGELVNALLPDDRPVKNSKFGVLYAQAPLMLEVRPTKRMFIDLGVTGGIRLAAWNRIKYGDGSNEKTYSNYLTNLFKCDASLRIGGDNLGFFANYALVPTFVNGRDAAKAHPLMLGFSLVF